MAVDLYAGIPVNDYATALAWYERLLGPPTFVASDTEAVWELAEHRSVVLDALVTQIAGRGLDPTKRETYPNGVRKATYHDPDGNEIDFGGAPLQPEQES